jgi:transposase-like protein
VVELARERAKPIAEIAADLGISESCLRRLMDVADVDEGHKEGLTSAERAELVELRRKLRVAEMEAEILKRAAYFAKENVLPKMTFAFIDERRPLSQEAVHARQRLFT